MARSGEKQFVIVDEKEGKKYDVIGRDTPLFSSDSRRIAYVAEEEKRWLTVVDDVEGKKYDLVAAASLVFSPDNRHVAYGAFLNDKKLVVAVLDENERRSYYGIVLFWGGRILYVSPDLFRYLVLKNGTDVYLVEERTD